MSPCWVTTRFGDRGVGGSTGNSTRETLDDMASDVLTDVEYLKRRKEIAAKHIDVIVHSEGGIVGPAAAARSETLRAIIRASGGSDQRVVVIRAG